MNSDDLMPGKIALAKFINEHSNQLIGFLDTKTTIIVGINGVLLGLRFQSNVINHVTQASLRILFSSIVILLGASAICGLIAIFPRIKTNLPYSNSIFFHEAVLRRKSDEKSISKIEKDVSDFTTYAERWGLGDNDIQEELRKDKLTDAKRILFEEILNTHRLAKALQSQFRWVRWSLRSLIFAVSLIVALLVVLLLITSSIYAIPV